MSSQHYGSRDCGCGGAKGITALGPTKSARSGHHARARATGQAASSGGGCGCGGSCGGDCGCGSPGSSCECNPGVLVQADLLCRPAADRRRPAGADELRRHQATPAQPLPGRQRRRVRSRRHLPSLRRRAGHRATGLRGGLLRERDSRALRRRARHQRDGPRAQDLHAGPGLRRSLCRAGEGSQSTVARRVARGGPTTRTCARGTAGHSGCARR